ncbi:MAG: ABC transporter permease [Gammaproteobacteria bacterium]|nr:ABC transporter permease [Gammaproteobacteria bacterium]HBW83492.1 iron ABC transporter permease [Gammaproteobacteria bacterium]
MKLRATFFSVSTAVAALSLLPVITLLVIASEQAEGIYLVRHEIFINTMIVVLGTAFLSILIGVPLAIITSIFDLPFKKILLSFLLMPLAVPSYMGAFAFYDAFGPGGELDRLLPITPPSVEGVSGTIFVLALYTYPFVLLTTRSALAGLDSNQIFAARTLGAGFFEIFLKVIIPRVTNAIAGGALLVGLYAISDFGTPAILGANTYTRSIFVEYNALGFSQAANLSLQLVFIISLFLALESRARITRALPSQFVAISLGRGGKYLAFLLVGTIIFVSTALPVIVFLFWLSREGVVGVELLTVMNSLLVSFVSAILIALIAIPVSMTVTKGRVGKALGKVIYLGFGIPGIVMGTAFIYVGLQFPPIYQTFFLLLLAYLLRFLPLSVSSIRSKLEGQDESLINAAKCLGAREYEIFSRITLPLLKKAIIGGGVLAFLETIRELPATLVLGPIGFETLATYMWRVYEGGYFALAAVPALLIMGVSVLSLVATLAMEENSR